MCQRRATNHSGNSYLGIHLGIERLEAVLLNAELQVTYTAVIRYDVDLPEYGTIFGVNFNALSNKFQINPVMYIKALDMLLNCLASQGADLHSVAAIGGAAHQYGAIYWSLAGFRSLCGLNPLMRLHEQLTEKSFSFRSFFYMNDSLNVQSYDMDEQLGGAEQISMITGSKSFVHTTASEIRKVFQDYPFEYGNTMRISLMSSFLASLFVGNIASIEYSDASRMNLLNIAEKQWSPECLNACAPCLSLRLMKAIATNRLQGRIADYFVNRWNFRSDCIIATATGSTASFLASLNLDSCFLFISLSDRDELVMRFTQRPNLTEGCIICHPTLPNEYVGLIRFRNGGKVRARICKEVANGDWLEFNEMLNATPMGNDNHIAVHFDEQDYILKTHGTLRWTKYNDELSKEVLQATQQFPDPKLEARALIEGQLMYYRAIAAKSGFILGPDTKVLVSGNYCSSQSILQIVADIFNAPVYIIKGPAAYVMGAAYRARYAFYEYREDNCNCRKCRNCRGRDTRLSYSEFIQQIPDNLSLVAEPTAGCAAIYEPLMARFMRMCSLLETEKTGKK
ncbi:xylulose kinase [Drosophila grimshawi]|uniref:xylulose kinase n=1 Tax=Drosophila grimshawi TaxID=7222 RepID=UPI001C933DC9|nr:xylulose kinase [Drosophila grimshawi]